MDTSVLVGHIPQEVIDQIATVNTTFQINTPLRLAHFLAQCSHESANFSLVVENLNYSQQSLLRVFPKYFPNAAIATSYARNPEKIGNRVYANRLGNGDEASGDGFRYRGRGYIQLTGKTNYDTFGHTIGVDLVSAPDVVSTAYALLSAGWFWNIRNINRVADLGATDDVVTQVTKLVNGGTIGLADRIAQFNFINGLLQ